MLSHRQHLLMSAMIWVAVSMMLTARGVVWVISNDPVRHLAAVGFSLVVVAGVLKGRFVLSCAAARIVRHIENLDEHSSFWKMYTLPTYLFVIVMVGLGILCRWAGSHWHIFWLIGYLYSAIGISLLIGSRYLWQAWSSAPQTSPGKP